MVTLFRFAVLAINNPNFFYKGLQTEPKARKNFEEKFGVRVVEVRYAMP